MTTRDVDGARTPHRTERPKRRSEHISPAGAAAVRLTARGAIVGMVLFSFASALVASLTELPVINGIGFLLACASAALLVRSGDLLSLSVSPPLAYFTAALSAEAVLTLGTEGFVRGVAIGMGTRLAEVAPWLFAGTALVLVVTIVRGLPANVRELGDELSGRRNRMAQRK
ncbi:DUF6542 domain-containing protein [Nocardiopsis ansamitocini]|uniref:DUF6542 domain-containing protein n=1 Tax=Nocardiopsis ansamitocini TaxID=1670832 RepID=A0A9W6P4F0_9ACTN|nr:DUF6542 domain-containing protein [Nocardiopsis ansamitocini]GLU46823.1 hypothetical protein Nans01_11740 [Nocardiopsis ansamitocini]